MRTAFLIYSLAMPLLGAPLAWWLWGMLTTTDPVLRACALGLPVAFGVLVPGVFSGWLDFWRFNTPLRLGRLTLLHGLMFGAATDLLAAVLLACRPSGPFGLRLALSALLLGSMVGFWNWIFDQALVRYGLAEVRNLPALRGQGPEAVVADYAPCWFGVFGAVLGAGIEAWRTLLVGGARPDLLLPWLVLSLLGLCIMPPAACALHNRWRHGCWVPGKGRRP